MMTFSFIAELIVGILLIVMIGYCYVLNRRLVAFKADEALMRSVVTDLLNATSKSEESIQALRGISNDCAATLQDRIQRGEMIIQELDRRMGHANVAPASTQAREVSGQTVSGLVQAPVMDGASLRATKPNPVKPRSANSALEKIRSRAA